MDWNSEQYLKFEKERTQPAIDLAGRMGINNPQKIADIGCGPGNSSEILKGAYPNVHVVGVDSSENMLLTAKKRCPDIDFILCDISKDISKIGCGFDAVFSNACLQWVPNHKKILPELFSVMKCGGMLAVQVPYNFDEPIHKIISRIAFLPKWKKYFKSPRIFYTLTPDEYYDILSQNSAEVYMWETTYYHILPSWQSILEWYRSTGMKPYIDALPDSLKPVFENAVMEQVKIAYPLQKDGKVLFKFPRLFFTAVKK